MTITSAQAPVAPQVIRFTPEEGGDEEGYLVSDGKPMAESHEHLEAMIYAQFALRTRFRQRSDVYISGNDFVHYVKGDRTRYISPDCYVVFGVESSRSRKNFKIWLEGASPAVVFEMTSPGTRREDDVQKFRLYEQVLQVAEYYRFDPFARPFDPSLRGDFLENERYRSVEPDAKGRIYSPKLDLQIGFIDEKLRFYDPNTGKALLSPEEEQRRADEMARLAEEQQRRADIEQQRAEGAQQRAQRAEEQIEIERERARAEQVRAEEQIEIERERARAEQVRAEGIEAELARLKAQLDALQQKEQGG